MAYWDSVVCRRESSLKAIGRSSVATANVDSTRAAYVSEIGFEYSISKILLNI